MAYGQNGEPLRVEQGYPIRVIVPGWEGPFNVKYLKHIKVVDQPYMAWNESMNHSSREPDLGGKARWYHFQWAPKSVITRPSAGMEMPARAMSRSPAWLGPVRARSAGSKYPPRRQDLEGSEVQGPVHSEGAYAVYVRLGLGRTRGDADVSLHG